MHLGWSATSYTSDRKPPQKGSNSGLPRACFHSSLSQVLSPTVSTNFSSKRRLLHIVSQRSWLRSSNETDCVYIMFFYVTDDNILAPSLYTPTKKTSVPLRNHIMITLTMLFVSWVFFFFFFCILFHITAFSSITYK